MKTPSVSIVVPTRNRGHLLPRLLHNLGQQELTDAYGDFEIVVVDDASTDDTEAVLSRWKDARVRVLRHEHKTGVAQARNDGTAAARGRWVAWCDDDDLWAPFKLRLQLDALADSPGSGWCNGGAAQVNEALQVQAFSTCPAPGHVLDLMVRTNIVTGGGSGVLADRELVESLGGFSRDLSIYADWEFWARLAEASPLAVVDAPLVAYVKHNGSMSHDIPRLLQELPAFQERLLALQADRPDIAEIDGCELARWILLQQREAGTRVATSQLVWRLHVCGLLPLKQAPLILLAAAAPQQVVALRRRAKLRRQRRDRRFAMYERMTAGWLPWVTMAIGKHQ